MQVVFPQPPVGTCAQQQHKYCNYTSNTNSSHLKIDLPKRTLVFQLSIFRDYVSFREGAL